MEQRRGEKILRVLEVVFSPSWGGLEMSACRFARYFRDLGHDVHMIAPAGSRIAGYCERHNIPVSTMKPLTKYYDPFTAYRVAKLARRMNADIVHAHMSKDLSTLGLAKKMYGKTALVFTQRMDSRYQKKDILHRWVFRQMDMLVAIAEHVRQNALEFFAVKHGQTMTIQNAVDTERFRPAERRELRQRLGIPEKAHVVGMSGRIDRHKRQDLLIEAAPKILERCPDTWFVFVGEETAGKTGEGFRAELDRLIEERSLQDRVLFAGFMEDVRDAIPSFDVSVLATPKETFGMVVIESMAMGVPVVATRAGGPPEIIEDGVDGMLFTPDDAGELADRVAELLKDSQRRQRMGKRARKKTEQTFDLRKKIVEYERLFYNLTTPVFVK